MHNRLIIFTKILLVEQRLTQWYHWLYSLLKALPMIIRQTSYVPAPISYIWHLVKYVQSRTHWCVHSRPIFGLCPMQFGGFFCAIEDDACKINEIRFIHQTRPGHAIQIRSASVQCHINVSAGPAANSVRDPNRKRLYSLCSRRGSVHMYHMPNLSSYRQVEKPDVSLLTTNAAISRWGSAFKSVFTNMTNVFTSVPFVIQHLGPF